MNLIIQTVSLGLLYPFAFSCPALHCCLLKDVLCVVTMGHHSWVPTRQQVEDGPYPTWNFMWLLFWQDDTIEISTVLKLLQRAKSFLQMVFGDLPVMPRIFMASASKIAQNLFDLEMYHLSWDCNPVFKRVQECWSLFSQWWFTPSLAHCSVRKNLILAFLSLFYSNLPALKGAETSHRFCMHLLLVSSTPKSRESAS